MKANLIFVMRAAGVGLVAAAFAPVAFAQSSSPRTHNERVERAIREEREARARAYELHERAADLRRAGEPRAPAVRPQPKLALAQIKEDFMRLQVVNNELAQAVSRGGALDLKFVAKSASEIRKRAGRLKENLALAEFEKVFERPETAGGAEAERLKSALSDLKELIREFVNNPLFKKANVVDVQLSAKARRDLEDIMDVSDEVKQSCARLHKAANDER